MVLLASGTSATHAQSDWMQAEEIVEAQLIAERAATAPGDQFHIGLHQIIPDGWHTYWRNPGDFGLPLELQWDLPPTWRSAVILASSGGVGGRRHHGLRLS